MVKDWETSAHAALQVGCLECHGASDAQRPDAFTHEGSRLVTLVTPADCGRCHVKEAREFASSRHAAAAQFVGSIMSWARWWAAARQPT